MFFSRLAVAALSIGAAFAAPINVESPKVGDVALSAGVPALVPRFISVQGALNDLTSSTHAVKSDLDSFNPTNHDSAKTIQLTTNLVYLEDCIDGAKTAISHSDDVLPLLLLRDALLDLKQVGDELQSKMENLKSIKGVGSRLAPIKIGVVELVTEVNKKAKGAGSDEIRSLAGPLPSLFTLL